MDRMELVSGIDPQRENLVVELRQNGKALGHVILDPATAESHIHALAKHRETLTDPVTPELEIGSYLDAVYNPVWRVPAARHKEGRVLALRHPGLGWLAFVLPDREAAQIAEWLTKDLPVDETTPQP